MRVTARATLHLMLSVYSNKLPFFQCTKLSTTTVGLCKMKFKKTINLRLFFIAQFNLHEDLTDVEAAQLLSAWSNLPTANLLAENSQSEVDSDLHHLVPLCRGSPLAVNVVGNLLLTQPHRVSDYLCNPKGAEPEFIDWVALSWPSAYGYDSVFQVRWFSFLPREY